LRILNNRSHPDLVILIEYLRWIHLQVLILCINLISLFLVVANVSARSIGYTNTTNVIVSYLVYIVITRNEESNKKLV